MLVKHIKMKKSLLILQANECDDAILSPSKGHWCHYLPNSKSHSAIIFMPYCQIWDNGTRYLYIGFLKPPTEYINLWCLFKPCYQNIMFNSCVFENTYLKKKLLFMMWRSCGTLEQDVATLWDIRARCWDALVLALTLKDSDK